ncbi:MAG: hypothetical protein AAB772_01465 [Patescibacteria group bacterium]
MWWKKPAFLFAVCFFAVQTQGCVSLAIKTKVEQQFVKPKTLPDFFNTPRSLPDIKFGKLNDENRKFSIQKFSFKSWQKSGYAKNDAVTGFLYLPKKPESNELFIIIPGIADDTSSALIAEIVAGLGHRAIRIKSGFRPLTKKMLTALSSESTDASLTFNDGSVFLVNAMRQRVIDLMRLNDFWETSMNPAGLKAHVIGISLGGIIGSLFSAVDGRVQSLMIINSSASIARILMDSKMIGFTPFKNSLMKKLGLSYQEAYAMIKEKVKNIEPISYASRLDRRKILIVSGGIDMIGFIDTAIPYSATKETWEAFGKPEWIIMPFAGHISSAVAFLPFWLELPNLLHTFKIFTFENSYAVHLIKSHFLPIALNN